METVTIIGYLAALCSMTSFTPQAWKIIKTRSTSGISALMYAITVLGFAFWLKKALPDTLRSAEIESNLRQEPPETVIG
jgi:uncharacterized protein with PQ loop repeat